MRGLLLLILPLVLLFSCEKAKNKFIISQEIVDDFLHPSICYDVLQFMTKDSIWMDEYKFMDSIEISKLTYWSDSLRIKGFVVKPKMKGNYPCIIYNRGGNDSPYMALKLPQAIETLGKLAKEGYVVIASNYRGGGGSEGDDEFGGKDVNDVVVLPQVLNEIESADTSRIGMYGWSRGGMMTLLALTKLKNIKAAVVGAGSSNLFNNERSRMEMVFKRLIPNYKNDRDGELLKRSPVNFVNLFPKETPILLLHGSEDKRVKCSESVDLANELKKFNLPYRLRIFEDGNHGLTENKSEVKAEILAWFETYL